jgi:endonuclease YncB( thermonuclease family)
MKRPEPGLAIPVVYRRTRDADTIEVSVPGSALQWAVRLIDVWAPELHGPNKELANEGRAWLDAYLSQVDPATLLLFIPLPEGGNPIHAITFDRVLGYLWAGNVLVNTLIVANGFGATTKRGPLGK